MLGSEDVAADLPRDGGGVTAEPTCDLRPAQALASQRSNAESFFR
jgi:hypothetical protein